MRTRKFKRYDMQIDREIEKAVLNFSEHLMSNSKWVRLIDALIEDNDNVKKVKFKKIHTTQIGDLFLEEDTIYEFDYWKNGFEGLNSLGGWLTYKEIEYLIFPRIIDDKDNLKQDLKAIVKTIESVGQFLLEIDEDEVKLICYKK